MTIRLRIQLHGGEYQEIRLPEHLLSIDIITSFGRVLMIVPDDNDKLVVCNGNGERMSARPAEEAP